METAYALIGDGQRQRVQNGGVIMKNRLQRNKRRVYTESTGRRDI